MPNIVGGPAIPISKVAATVPIRGQAAIPVQGFVPANVDRAIEGGPARPVYVVTQADLNAGKFTVAGNVDPIPMCTITDGRAVAAGPALPVWVVGGAL